MFQQRGILFALLCHADFILACHATFIILITMFQFYSYFSCIVSYKTIRFFLFFKTYFFSVHDPIRDPIYDPTRDPIRESIRSEPSFVDAEKRTILR